jgi:hypothetical protein
VSFHDLSLLILGGFIGFLAGAVAQYRMRRE